MKFKSMSAAFVLAVLLTGTSAFAQSGQTSQDGNAAAEPASYKGVMIYFGTGSPRGDVYLDEYGKRVNRNPVVFGVLVTPNDSRLVAGFDIAGEGVMLDSTYASGGTSRIADASDAYTSPSFNGIIGVNVGKTEHFRFDVAGILGGRLTSEDCPGSYLGYRCYADRAPDRTFGINYGALTAVSYRKLMVGARFTNNSAQGLIGVRF